KAGDSPAVVWRAARAHRLVGDLHEHLGEARPAAQHYRQAVALYGTLVEREKDPGRKADYRAERAGAYMNLWRVLEGVDAAEAGPGRRPARRGRERPPDAPAGGALPRRDRAALLNNRGIRAHQAGDLRRAEEDYRAAEALLADLAGPDDCRLELARTRVNLA